MHSVIRFFFLSTISWGSLFVHAGPDTVSTVTGFVFHDLDGNGKRDPGEPGVAGVPVSNGQEIVITDATGNYQLSVNEGFTVFVIKPRNWAFPLNEDNLPQFYRHHHSQGSAYLRFGGISPTEPLPESLDFPLTASAEPDRFRVLYIGDSQTEDQRELDWYARDIVEELVGIDDVAFATMLGDIVNDDLSMFPSINAINRTIGVPMFNIFGNHDMDFDTKTMADSDASFSQVFGPSTYIFQYGPVHFIHLNNVIMTPGGARPKYIGGFRPEALRLVENYLKHVPSDQLVVLAFHIPLFEPAEWGKTFRMDDRDALFRLFGNHPRVLSLSAHTHIQRHVYFGQSDGWPHERAHHHYNVGTSCGSWWTGIPDVRGIPDASMRDGTPNGYAIITFSENEYVIDWKVAGSSPDHVMAIDTPEVARKGEYPVASLSVNVFNGCERTQVWCRFNRSKEWVPMDKVERYDPRMMKLWAAYETSHEGLPGRRINPPDISHHLWSLPLPNSGKPGLQLAEVKVTDPYGRTHYGHRLWRLIPEG